jgi:hypothetical protein
VIPFLPGDLVGGQRSEEISLARGHFIFKINGAIRDLGIKKIVLLNIFFFRGFFI